MTPQTWLVDLPAEQCAQLLAEVALGRLGVIVEGRPEIYPVSHLYDRASGCVAFPTNAGTKLHAALHWPWVAFEVDGLDPGGASGWSVLLVGRAEALSDPDEIARMARQRPVLWRAGNNVQWIRIVPSRVTGRRISAVDR